MKTNSLTFEDMIKKKYIYFRYDKDKNIFVKNKKTYMSSFFESRELIELADDLRELNIPPFQ